MPFPGHLLGGIPPTQRLLQGPQAQQQQRQFATGAILLPENRTFFGPGTQPQPVQGQLTALAPTTASEAANAAHRQAESERIHGGIAPPTGPVTLQQNTQQGFNDGSGLINNLVGPGGLQLDPTTNTEQTNFHPAVQALPTTQQPVAAQPQGPLPQFGLAGAEQAFGGALNAGLGAVQGGTSSALQALLAGGGVAQGQFQQGIDALSNRFDQAGQLNQQAQQQLQQAQQQAFAQSQAAQRQGLGAISSGISAGQAQLSPFSATGATANQSQAALSGALGPEAQAQAFADFQSSPGQDFLREQGELGVINQQAALGGLGGGNVRKELSRFNQGLAAQDFQNTFNRQGAVANRGATAAGQSAQLAGQGALASGNLISSLGGQRANLAGQLGSAGAGFTGQLAGQGLQVGGQELGARQNLGNLFGNLASQGAGFQQQAGTQAANLFQGAGSQIGGARLGAGRDIAGNIQSTTQGLSDLSQRQGAGLSDILGGGAANIANLLSGAGQFDAQQQQQLAQLLANLQTGQGTQLSNIALQGGATAGAQAQQQGAGEQAALENLLAAFVASQGGS